MNCAIITAVIKILQGKGLELKQISADLNQVRCHIDCNTGKNEAVKDSFTFCSGTHCIKVLVPVIFTKFCLLIFFFFFRKVFVS